MISKISNNINNKNLINKSNNVSFKGTGFDTITKAADLFIKSQENLSSTRFIQDTATNWFPKAIFSRSKEDFAEMSFLEFLESAIFYFASPLLGEKLLRNKVFKNFAPEGIRKEVNEQIANSLKEITENTAITNEVKNRAIATKAGIVLACTAIPVAEYTLSFAKNYFTLKAFEKSNFNDIANLDKKKNEGETKEHQKLVEKHAISQFKKAAIISTLGATAGITLALTAHKSQPLIEAAKTILEPGKAISETLHKTGINSEKADKLLKGISLDFANDNGKLALSKGQLGLTAIIGLFGYSKAAEDRGKLDKQEVWTRVPLVVFYTIFGSELFEKGFINILNKKNKCQDVIKKSTDGTINVLKRKELDEAALNLAKEKGTKVQEELSKLIKQKAFVSAIPYLFSLIFMGFTLSAITRFCTQRRYDKQKEQSIHNNLNQDIFSSEVLNKLPDVYSDFKSK